VTSDDTHLAEPTPELHRRTIAAGAARVAVFRRCYQAPIDDVWDACTNPDRLRRWYVPVSGDLRIGGTFEQALMGSGEVVKCEPPHRLKLSLGGGADEIELSLSVGEGAGTLLELQHATTIDEHEIGGQMFDAIFCMGGGYYPRLVALDRHLRGELPADYNPVEFHLRADMRPIIERGSAAMAQLLASEGEA
jgi:uncharacterized protein YndB with AHSA1/START domain